MSLPPWQHRFIAELDAHELPATSGMQVYHHNVRAQFRKALAVSFPMVAELLGPSCFSALAERFRQRNPSRSGDLHPSGTNFPLFLATELEATDTAQIDLAELAHLEWAWQCALIAPDQPAIDAASLAAFSAEQWPSLRLKLQPSFTVLRSRSPVMSYWQAQRTQNKHPPRTSGPEQAWLVGTPRGPVLQRCSAETADWLEAIAAGANLTAALTLLDAQAQNDPNQAADLDVAAVLGRLFASGAVVSVEIGADDHT